MSTCVEAAGISGRRSSPSRPLRDCPACGKASAKRQVSGGTGFLLKGGGWYADGYGSKGPAGGDTEKKSDTGSPGTKDDPGVVASKPEGAAPGAVASKPEASASGKGSSDAGTASKGESERSRSGKSSEGKKSSAKSSE